ncbi:Bifunctional oligoribonuclease and PAP phosphatase nrnA [Mycoplasmopsis citelli]|uniref:Bifunctional oligoribonuclease and PAP phosphatase nrnA n=1 Tax=Mycoplasmopsis citelli TaxID=171281 RepID=A0A449B1P1_9BACT|nr:bifunctional oligoribonuclease/PAP phosphatase NrnA [Mycoplasmopsis citelli]VEU74520.1 Bifunctional oligoribonuclease and PAP phosphatase nrnA [Mycoplasmopsis citelli]
MLIGNSKVAKDAIEKYDSIVIFHHIRPDGDCLGSQHGLAELIKTNYPNKKVYCVGDNVGVLDFMQYHFTDEAEVDYHNSLGIVVDASSGDRIEKAHLLYENKTTAKLRIDHHPNGSDIEYDYLWVDEHYVAAAEMIAMLAYESKWEVSKSASEYIYLGINTDSGRFLYPDTSPRTHKLVAFLMENGFHPQKILKELSKRTFRGLKFIGDMLAGFKKSGRVLYFEVTSEVLAKHVFSSLDASMYVNELANVEDNACWALFIQLEDGSVRGRLRSNGPLVNKVANEFNGGGHDNAAGITLSSWEQVPEVLERLNKEIIIYESENK